MKKNNYDLIILGASASGISAAIQAARNKLKVAVIEESISIGGMITAAGVSAFDGNHLIAGGIFKEFRDKLRNYYNRDILDTGWVSNTLFEPEVGIEILYSMIDENYCDLYLDCNHIQINKIGNNELSIDSVFFNQANRQYQFKSNYFILADEFGDAIYHLNLQNHYGLEKELDAPYELKHPQDFTYNAVLQFDNKIKVIDEYPLWTKEGEFAGILGNPEISLTKMLEYGMLPNNKIMLNWPIKGNDYYGNYFIEDRQSMFIKAKEKTMRLFKLIQSSVDLSCNLRLSDNSYPLSKDKLPYIPYIREARRIYGNETLSIEDITNNKIFKTAIAVGDYPLDHHRDLDEAYNKIDFPKIHPFSVPFGSLIPLRTKNILVVEKSISVSGLVNGCTRLQPVVMQLGQVAALAVYLAKKEKICVNEINIEELQDLILDNNGYLYPTHDVSLKNPKFKDTQIAIREGSIKLGYLNEGWVNKSYCINA